MSMRKEPFPSSVEGCEELLYDVTSYGDRIFDPGVIAPPQYPLLDFQPTGALLGEYGNYVIRPQSLIDVVRLADPDNLEDFSELQYRVIWEWKQRRLGARATRVSWYTAPHGEDYSDKYIVAMALFRTYYGQLNDQAEARRVWQKREHDVETYVKQRTPEQRRRDLHLTLADFEKVQLEMATQAAGLAPPNAAPTTQDPFLEYTPQKEPAIEEPTNEELGVLPVQSHYEQPPWQTPAF